MKNKKKTQVTCQRIEVELLKMFKQDQKDYKKITGYKFTKTELMRKGIRLFHDEVEALKKHNDLDPILND